MFSETRLGTSYFQQMTLHSKISKIIDTQLQNNLHPTPFLERSVNYFENFRAEYHLLKLSAASLVSPNIGGVSLIYS